MEFYQGFLLGYLLCFADTTDVVEEVQNEMYWLEKYADASLDTCEVLTNQQEVVYVGKSSYNCPFSEN